MWKLYKCVTAFPEMQTYSNVHSRGLANNKMQMLHEDSLKGVTVNGQMLVSTEYQPLYQVKTRIIFIKETNKSTWRRGNCWFGFNTVNFFFVYREVLIQFPKHSIKDGLHEFSVTFTSTMCMRDLDGFQGYEYSIKWVNWMMFGLLCLHYLTI